MAQFGRPIADTSIGGFTDQALGTTNIYLTIDEVSPSDADYIQSALAPSAAPYATALTASLEDPITSTGHVVRWRQQKSATGGATVNLTTELREGYVSEGTPGTLIATCESAVAMSDAWTTRTYNLSGGEADAITDYTALALRFVCNQV